MLAWQRDRGLQDHVLSHHSRLHALATAEPFLSHQSDTHVGKISGKFFGDDPGTAIIEHDYERTTQLLWCVLLKSGTGPCTKPPASAALSEILAPVPLPVWACGPQTPLCGCLLLLGPIARYLPEPAVLQWNNCCHRGSIPLSLGPELS